MSVDSVPDRAGAAPATGPKTWRRPVLIVNAKSRKGAAAFDEAKQRLADSSVELASAHDVQAPEEMSGLIKREVAAGADLVIIGGGDGSMRGGADALARGSAVMGVLPLGTVNDFARNLGIEATVEGACRVIAEGNTVEIDVGYAGKECFLITASVGFSAEAQTALSPGLKKALGPLGYAAAGLVTLSKLKKMRVTVEYDGKREELPAIQAGVINGHKWMGGAVEIPGVDLESGKQAFYVVPPCRWLDAWRILQHFRHGQFFRTPGLRAFTTTEVRISTRTPRNVVLDGDLCGQTPVTFCVVPGGLRVCAPPPEIANS